MIKRLLLSAVLAAASANAFSAGVTYKLDPNHTDVIATWSHFGFSHPSAHFGGVDGTLVYDSENVSKSSVQVTLPLSGLNGYSDKFNAHLNGADFFDAAKFPAATFRSTKVRPLGENRLEVTGDLTIKDATRTVVLDVVLNKAGPHPMSKADSIGFDATATIKRSEFGLGMFAPAVSDEVKLRITIEASVPMAGQAAQ